MDERQVIFLANLTSKEAIGLSEQLGSEKVLVAKYRDLASQCTDIAIKTKLEQIAAKHQQHYDKIVSYLG